MSAGCVTVTRFIEAIPEGAIQWVYNILDGSAEVGCHHVYSDWRGLGRLSSFFGLIELVLCHTGRSENTTNISTKPTPHVTARLIASIGW